MLFRSQVCLYIDENSLAIHILENKALATEIIKNQGGQNGNLENIYPIKNKTSVGNHDTGLIIVTKILY